MNACRKCNETKQDIEFSKNSKRKSGLHTICRQCSRLASKVYRFSIRYEVLSHYSQGIPRCECCKETNLEFLAIDHINGGGSKHIKSLPGASLARHLYFENYPEGYRVLCDNCNRSLGAYGYCPHKTQSTFMDFVEATGKKKAGGGLYRAKLKIEQVQVIKKLIDAGSKDQDIADQYDVVRETITRIRKGQTWKEVSYSGV